MYGSKPNCLKCKHYHKDDFDKFSCAVYPDGIPDEIVDNEKHCEKEDLTSATDD